MRRALCLAVLSGVLAAGAMTGGAAEAQADHWKKRHHHHGPPWAHGAGWHHRHGHHHRHSGFGFGTTILFESAPRTVYVERPPRVVYVEPEPEVVYVQPQPRYEPSYADEGRYCREVNKRVMIDGRPQNAYGTACYQPDGSWQWVND